MTRVHVAAERNLRSAARSECYKACKSIGNKSRGKDNLNYAGAKATHNKDEGIEGNFG